MLTRLRPLVGLLLSAALLWVFLRAVDANTLATSLKGANYYALLPAVLFYFAGVWLRSARWRLLLRPLVLLPTRRLFNAMVIGFTVNNLTPMRLGELARAFLLARWSHVPAAATLGTIVVERLFDGLVLCGLLALAWPWLPPTSWLRLAALVGTLGFVVGSAVGVGAAVWPSQVMSLARLCTRPLPARLAARALGLAASFLDGFAILRSGRQLGPLFLLSVGAWLCEAAMYYVIMLGFNLGSGPISALLGMAAANLGTMVPSSPSYVGTFDVPLQTVLIEMFGVDPGLATSYTLVVHSALIVPVVVVGLILLWREGISVADLSRRLGRRRRVQASTGPVAETL